MQPILILIKGFCQDDFTQSRFLWHSKCLWLKLQPENIVMSLWSRVGVKYSTCTWYLYLSTYLSVLAVLEYLVYGNVKVLVLVLDQRVLGTYK